MPSTKAVRIIKGHAQKTEECERWSALPSLGCHDFSKESYFWKDEEFDYSNIFSASTINLNTTKNKEQTHTGNLNIPGQHPNTPLSEPHKDSDERKCRGDSVPKKCEIV